MENNKSILFLINPVSGNGTSLKTAKIAVNEAIYKGYKTFEFVSEYAGHLSQFTQHFNLNEIDKIAVIGGDGSMHEVINAAANNPEWLEIPYVLFPSGTGNAFTYDLNCLTNKKAIDLLLNGKETLIDLAEVKSNGITIWSFNIIGCGLVADINLLAEKIRRFKSARYNIASVINIVKNPTFKAKVTVNNQVIDSEFCFLLACNTRYTGKAMKMAPLAKLNDGLIDFLIVEKTSRFKLLTLFPKIFSGKHLESPILKYIQTNYIKIETQQAGLVNIDGEIKGNTPLEMTIHKQKLKILT